MNVSLNGFPDVRPGGRLLPLLGSWAQLFFEILLTKITVLRVGTPQSNVKRMRESTKMAGEMSAQIIGVNSVTPKFLTELTSRVLQHTFRI